MPLSNDFTFNPEKTVLKNIESLQKLIRNPKFTDENSYKTQDRKEAFTALFAMRMAVNATRGEKSSLKANVTQAQYEAALLGARAAAGAVRGKKESLEKKLEAAALGEKVQSFRNDPSFRAFVTDPDSGALEAAQKGHGGALEDKFREYVKKLDRLPEQLPAGYTPTALERVEALQKRIKSAEFNQLEPDQQDAMLMELTATRGAIQAQRGDKHSLEGPVPLANLGPARNKLEACQTFKDFLRADPQAARKAALSSHGGKLEDDFGKDLVRQTYQDGVLPQGDQERFRPKTADFMNETNPRLKQDLAAKSPLVINNEIDAYKRRIAGMMYMAKVENDNQRKADRNEMLDEAKMTQAVNTLTASQAFNNLFNGANAYQMVQLAANGNLSTIFTRFANASGQLQARRPQPVQPVLQQNQPVADQIQQPAQI